MTSLRLKDKDKERSRILRFGLRRVWMPALAMTCVSLALIVIAAFAVTPRAAADDRPPGGRFSDPVIRAVDVAQPSIVRLAAIYTVHVTMTLCGQSYTLPARGNGYTLGATGSGAFISANGDILTADHVVDVPKDLLDQAIFQEPNSAADIANLLDTNPTCHLSQSVSATDVAAGYVQYAGIPYSVHYSSPRRLMWQSTAFTGPVSDTAASSTLEGLLAAPSHEVTVVSASSVDENDLAIVHADMTDTPNIQLDNSASVAVEDQLTIIGYPGNGDVTNDGTDLLTPSVNVISISAIKSGDNGEQLIEVGGNVEHGDSGGPALDARGHIVGIVSFGFVGPDSPGSTAFLRSSNSVRSLISAAGINTAPGPFEKAWEAAFSDYAATYAGHWHAAALGLDNLSGRYPGFKGIQQFKDYADQAASVETLPNSPPVSVEVAGGVAAFLVLLIALIARLVAVRKRKAQPAVAVASQAAPFGATYPYAGLPSAYGPPSQWLGGYASPSGYGFPAGMSRSSPGQASANGWTQSPAQSGFALPPAFGATPPTSGFGSYPGALPSIPMGPTPPTAPYAAASGIGAPAAPPASTNGYAAAPSADHRWTPPAGDSESPWSAGSFGMSGGDAMAGAGAPAPATGYGYCVNGHPLAVGEQYCAQCGAPRWAAG